MLMATQEPLAVVVLVGIVLLLLAKLLVLEQVQSQNFLFLREVHTP